ncbi:hypothetical protein ACHAO4_007095 [Trichoderma viride]
MAALDAMQIAAAQYLAAIWSQGDVYELITVQCLYNSSRAGGPTSSKMEKKKKKEKKKKENRKGIQKQTGKDVDMSQFLNQGTGLAVARNVMIREMLTYNRKISETLQKDNETSDTAQKNTETLVTFQKYMEISEMLQKNNEILETLQRNNEILKKLLRSPAEENEAEGPTNSQG